MLNPPIGILGGTFDPIHFGHLRTALEIQQALHLACVHIIPCYQPAYAKQPVASPEERWEMVNLAVEAEPALKADGFEIAQKGPSYSIHTLINMSNKHPNTPLCLIMGIDALRGFTSWHQWEKILTLAHLIIAHRPQYTLPTSGPVANLLTLHQTPFIAELRNSLAGKIFFHAVTPLEISSTEIRKQLATGLNPRFLLPDSVYNYLKEHGIYSLSSI